MLSIVGQVLASDRIYSERDPSRVYIAVEIDKSILEDRNAAFNSHISSWRYEHPLSSIPNHHLFSVPEEDANDVVDMGPHIPARLQKRSPLALSLANSGVVSLEVLRPRKLHKRMPIPFDRPVDSSMQGLSDIAQALDIKDPIFPQQWHLYNPIQPGHDINVTGLWLHNITGEGVRIAVIDDGLDMFTEDLKNNYFAEGSWDFNDPGPFPKPRLSDDRHGTRCAGEIAAVRNNACGVGVAYDSKVAGIRILSKRIMPADEALAINFEMQKNHIYSCSWGPSDDGQTMEAPPEVVKKAMMTAIQQGRDSKGSLYVFASGNGGNFQDNCNFDGYTNSIYSITVASIDRRGLHPGYSESCSANMVVTYSSGSGDYIHTTDVGGACADRHGGTSAAAPIAAGIFALVLQVRPELTWRDMQYLAFETAVPFDLNEPGWQTVGGGKHFHHMYGFGKLDAYSMVETAKTWELVKPQAWYHLPIQTENTDIPINVQGVEFKTKVTKENLTSANFKRLEHVNVLVNANSPRRGDLSMELVSPSGTVSQIMPMRYLDSSPAGVHNWKFMSVVHWNEEAEGEWRLIVKSNESGAAGAKLIDWQLQLWGESEDAEKAMLFPGPGKQQKENGESDGNKDNWGSGSSDSKPAPSTPSSAPPAQESSSTPTDHEAATSPSPSATAGPSAEPSGSSESDEKESEHSDSLIPTFGMSGHTAAWVYGSALIIFLFIGGVCLYLFLARRRRGGSDSKSYAFNPLLSRPPRGDDDEEGDELAYLREFSLSDDGLGHSDDEDFHRGARSDGGAFDENPSTYLSAGKKARDLYAAPAAHLSTASTTEPAIEKSKTGEKEGSVGSMDEDPFKLNESDDEDQLLAGR